MKKVCTLLCLVLLFLPGYLFGQSNTFPTNGNIGIGTLTPTRKLEVIGEIGTNSNLVTSNPANNGAVSFLGWMNNIARIRIGGIGEGAANGLDIQTIADVSLMRLLHNGNVGIGTTSPAYKLDISSGDLPGVRIGPNSFYGESLFLGGWTTNVTSSRIATSNGNLHLDSKLGRNIYLNHYHNGNIIVGAGTSKGNVGIGVTVPTHRLEVNGIIRAKEVKLEATNWPDYVFEKDYELMPLEKVKSYIDQKGHLPGLKTAREYDEEGVSILEMNQKLLEKVEELTLHLIEQEKRIKQLERKQQN
ncbi:hypothetical protein MM239_04860 [Belliella sp. DSM 111904]|uniref:Chaperone of endosialidase n=1 Tax=Belliella filtrata TaxID=2923435 RepID=A0ABS9UXP9_9BACT|nr:hypothetical protein [Belliella filtrata]MCH7408714.1 hypothetical protein [Belliella filtrata]